MNFDDIPLLSDCNYMDNNRYFTHSINIHYKIINIQNSKIYKKNLYKYIYIYKYTIYKIVWCIQYIY